MLSRYVAFSTFYMYASSSLFNFLISCNLLPYSFISFQIWGIKIGLIWGFSTISLDRSCNILYYYIRVKWVFHKNFIPFLGYEEDYRPLISFLPPPFLSFLFQNFLFFSFLPPCPSPSSSFLLPYLFLLFIGTITFISSLLRSLTATIKPTSASVETFWSGDWVW